MDLEEITSTEDTALETLPAPDMDSEAKPNQLGALFAWARGRLPLVAFVGGLLLGWIVLGWLLFPVQWTNTDPWDLRPEHQRRIITLVADDFWRTGDIRRVKQVIGGWEEKALAKLLTTMQAQERNPETRQHLVALADALKMPQAGQPLVASLLSDKGVLLSVALASVPLVAALALVAYSLLMRPAPAELEVEREPSELPLEELELLEAGQQNQPDMKQPGQQQPEEEKKKPAPVLDAQGTGEVSTEGDDFLTGLLEEADENVQRLEALSKGLDVIAADDLLRLAQEVRQGLVAMNAG